MIRNYFKTAFRNLLREKGVTIINIAGLALGITGSLVVYLFISDAKSFDTYHSKFDRIYRIVSQSAGNHGVEYTQAIPKALPDAVKEEFREVEEVAFTSYRRGGLIDIIRDGEVKKYEEPTGLAISEPSFFRIFDRDMVIGSAEKGLDDPNEAIISKRWALKYFGKEDAIGELVRYENIDYRISAVMEDHPTNTDLPFDLILSWITIKEKAGINGWGDYSDTDNCYILLAENENASTIMSRLSAFSDKYTGDAEKTTFLLQPLADLHSDGRFANYNKKLPSQAHTVLAVIAVFLLLTACINFVNMATAEALKRTREVGIRKVLGGGRLQLIVQFLIEAFLVVAFAIFVSLGAAQMFLAWLNQLLDARVTLQPTLSLAAFLTILLFGVTILSGIYPAWLMSSFRPTDAMKNMTSSKTNGGFTLRKSLVVLQFFISQFFIIGTLVLVDQMDYMGTMYMGFEKSNIVAIPIPVHEKPGETKMRTLREEVMRLSGVSSATLSYSPPSYKAVISTSVSIEGSQEPFSVQVKQVDGNFLDVFGIRLLEGEGLPDADTVTGILVNQKFIEVAGFTGDESIVGKEVYLWGKNFQIKGVVRNFNTQSLSEVIEPLVMLNNIHDYQFLSVKIASGDGQSLIPQIKKSWETAYPEYIFQYSFIDDQVKSLYRGETKITSMIKVFAGMAIFIGCLGLLGLVTYMANRRTKEIGVRKLLGASVQKIVLLFTSELWKLLIIGFALAAPVAGYFMELVLEEFAYRIDLGPAIFLKGLSLTFLVASLTIGYRSFKAVSANPVEALKSE